MRIHGIVNGTRANGPGLRSAIWTQGCVGMDCPGCQNPSSHDPNKGDIWDGDELAAHIVHNAHQGVTGVTISGGEPMHQAVSLNELLCGIKARRPDWSIGMFSGYSLTELWGGRYDCREPLAMAGDHGRACLWEHSIKPRLDWAVTDRYDLNKPVPADLDYALFGHKRLCSSMNQNLWLLSRRFSYEDFGPKIMEVNIDADGFTQISGFPPAIKINEGENV